MSFQRILLSPLFPVPQHTRSRSAVTWLLLGNCCLTVIFPLQLILSSVLAYCFIHFLVLFCIFKNLNIFPHQSNTLYRFFFNPNKHWDLLRNRWLELQPILIPKSCSQAANHFWVFWLFFLFSSIFWNIIYIFAVFKFFVGHYILTYYSEGWAYNSFLLSYPTSTRGQMHQPLLPILSVCRCQFLAKFMLKIGIVSMDLWVTVKTLHCSDYISFLVQAE